MVGVASDVERQALDVAGAKIGVAVARLLNHSGPEVDGPLLHHLAPGVVLRAVVVVVLDEDRARRVAKSREVRVREETGEAIGEEVLGGRVTRQQLVVRVAQIALVHERAQRLPGRLGHVAKAEIVRFPPEVAARRSRYADSAGG